MSTWFGTTHRGGPCLLYCSGLGPWCSSLDSVCIEASRLCCQGFWYLRSNRPLLTFVGSLLVGVAILDPRWSSGAIELPFRGRNVVVLLDASRSMRCQDAGSDRLQVAKTLLGELAESAIGDRFGLIAFAGTDPQVSAYCRSPRLSPCPPQVDPEHMPVGVPSRETPCGKRLLSWPRIATTVWSSW